MPRPVQAALLVHHPFKVGPLQGQVSRDQQSWRPKGRFLAGEMHLNFEPGQGGEFRFRLAVQNGDCRGARFVRGDDQPLQHRQARQRTLAGRIIGKNQNGQTHVSFASQTRVMPPWQGK